MRQEYAIKLYDPLRSPRKWFDAYPTKALVMRAALDLIRDSPDGWSAGIWKRTSDIGQIGATWERIENVGPLT